MQFVVPNRRHFVRTLNAHVQRKPRRFFLGASFFLALLLVIVLYLLVKKEPFVVVDALTESVIYRVRRPQLAAVPLENAIVRGHVENCSLFPAADEPSNFTGIVTPSVGSIVTYRYTPTQVSIEIDGGNYSGGNLTSDDGVICALPQRIRFVADINNVVRRPLPLVGPADIGREMSVPDSSSVLHRSGRDFMFGGTVQVFGRAVAPPFRGDLYPSSSNSFPLPAGGRVSSGDSLSAEQKDSGAPAFYGVVSVDSQSFKVSASTVSKELKLYRPGMSGEKEVFGLGMLALVFSDPSVIFITVFIASFSFSMQLLKTLHDIAKKNFEDSGAGDSGEMAQPVKDVPHNEH